MSYFRRSLRRLLGAVVPNEGTSVDQATAGEKKSLTGFRFYLRYLSRDRSALIGGLLVLLFLAYGLIEGIMQELAVLTGKSQIAYLLLPSNPFVLDFKQVFVPPCLIGSLGSCSSLSTLLGTNNEGQSILSRLLYATPHDALAAVLVVSTGIVVGMFVGTSAGYFGGLVDEILMRLTDTFLALPGLILAIAISILLGSGYNSALISLLIIWWPTYARFFRGQVLQIKNRGYVEAAKFSGIRSYKIMFRHLFPNSVDPIIAYATLDFGSVILTFSTLAFIGIGVQFGYPEWGAEASNGITFFPQYWWLAIIPSALIMAIVVAFSLVGDRLQDLIGGRAAY